MAQIDFQENMTHAFRFMIFFALLSCGCVGSEPTDDPRCAVAREVTGSASHRAVDAARDHYAPPSQYDKVRRGYHELRNGMTKEEVSVIIGDPPMNRSTELWVYEFLDTGMADREIYTIRFENGKMIDKSSAGIHDARPDR